MLKGVLNTPLLKNKAGVRCTKRTLNATTTWYMFKYIAIILANVWLPTLEQHFRSTILKFVWLFKLVFPSRRMISYLWYWYWFKNESSLNLEVNSETYSESCQTSNMEVFRKNNEQLLVFDYFGKTLHLRCLTRFSVCLWSQ